MINFHVKNAATNRYLNYTYFLISEGQAYHAKNSPPACPEMFTKQYYKRKEVFLLSLKVRCQRCANEVCIYEVQFPVTYFITQLLMAEQTAIIDLQGLLIKHQDTEQNFQYCFY